MSKFKSVLSDGEIFDLLAAGNKVFSADSDGDIFHDESSSIVDWFDLLELFRSLEQAVLAKLHEQKPVMHARTHNGEIDWSEDCVTKEYDEILLDGVCGEDDDGNKIKDGYDIMPLYSHPKPVVEQKPIGYLHANGISFLSSMRVTAEQARSEDYNTPLYTHPCPSLLSDKTGCVSEKTECETQEPFAWFIDDKRVCGNRIITDPVIAKDWLGMDKYKVVPLYTHPTPALEQEPDMFWDADNPERLSVDCIHDVLVGSDPEVGATVEIQSAVLLKNTLVKVLGYDEGSGDYQYEVLSDGKEHHRTTKNHIEQPLELARKMVATGGSAERRARIMSAVEIYAYAAAMHIRGCGSVSAYDLNEERKALELKISAELTVTAESAISSLEGWQLVPKEPGRDTLKRMFYEQFGLNGIEEEHLAARYRNMLSSLLKYTGESNGN